MSPIPHSKNLLLYLMFTAVTCGAMVMVVEILGSRVIGPFFGVGLFVWTSLIAVTLLALALGYWLGGHLADRNDHPDHLYTIILASGLLVLAIPLLKTAVLEFCLPLGLRLGAFTSTLLLFGPSLFLLGCVSPYLVKIATREFHLLGRTVGRFYALSTLGSVVGTVLAGFFLIAYFGVNAIFQVAGGLLILLSVVYFVAFRRRRLMLLALLLPLAFTHVDKPVNLVRDDGVRVKEEYVTESFYGQIKVVDFSYQEQHVRDLVIDGLTQGGIDMITGLPLYEYMYLLTFVPYSMLPSGSDGLAIGLGAGLIPSWYERQGVKMDAVEIDETVARIARDYFNLNIKGEIYIQDARHYLTTSNKKYDYIIMDVFSGDLTPGHLVSLEAFGLVKKMLKADGIFGINLIASLQEDTFITASVFKTLQQLFQHIDIYPAAPLRQQGGTGNMIIVAHNGMKKQMDLELLANQPVYPLIREDVLAGLRPPMQPTANDKAIVLTDDYNPIEFFEVHTREQTRSSIFKNSELDILLN